MSNSIQINACDNELIIVAYNPNMSYVIGRIISGNHFGVNVNVALSPGDFSGGFEFNGLGESLNESTEVTIPSGDYSIQLLGLDWAQTDAQFTVVINETTYSLPLQTYNAGLVWYPEPIDIKL